MPQIEPLDDFAVNRKSSGSLDMRFLTTKRGNFHASKCPKGDDFRGTLIKQALHLSKAHRLRTKCSKMAVCP